MAPVPPPENTMRRKVVINFGLFFLFFVFYLLAAVIQTPTFKEIAAVPVLDMPLGLLMSMLVFPVSWVIMILWFWRSK